MWTPSPALPLKENLRDFWKAFVDAAKVSPQTLYSPYQHLQQKAVRWNVAVNFCPHFLFVGRKKPSVKAHGCLFHHHVFSRNSGLTGVCTFT